MHSELEPVVAPWMNEELTLFREVAERFVTERMAPHDARWRREHCVGRQIWREAGEAGLLCTDIPAEYGGGGGDFRHESIVHEALARRGLVGFATGVHSICAQYINRHGTHEQKQRWLPRLARGELVGAIAMTEPGAGSDLQVNQNECASRRAGLHHQRCEDVYHQRFDRGVVGAGRENRSGATRLGNVDPHGRDGGSAGLSGRQRAR